MGLDLMPWQRHVLDVALEERPDGRLKYDEVNLTVPRQNGKTTTVVPLAMLIVMTEDYRAVAYSAQGISEALQKWRYEMMPKLEKSPIGKGAGLKYLKSIGLAGIECTKTSSVLRILPSSESTGHAPTICMAIHDEAWDAVDSTREQAYKPAMITVDDAQYWVMSVAGTVDSSYLRDKVVSGRKIVEDGRSEEARVAYFEWAVDENADWRDQRLWGPANPALGHTIAMDRLVALSQSMAPDDFRRP
ncbi:MAG: terminase large subunit, partial [Rhodospirillaceae bacterium]|nr:terminase large subunit [Rhodospirillaceae bacterium]